MKTLAYSQHRASLKKKRKKLNAQFRDAKRSILFYHFSTGWLIFWQSHEGQQKQLPSANVKAQVVFHFANVLLSFIRKHPHVATTRDLFDLDTEKDHITPCPENENIRQKRNRKGEKIQKWNCGTSRIHENMFFCGVSPVKIGFGIPQTKHTEKSKKKTKLTNKRTGRQINWTEKSAKKTKRSEPAKKNQRWSKNFNKTNKQKKKKR